MIDRWEMNWRNSILAALAICCRAALSGTLARRRQTRVGEAAVVKNEVVRVTGSGAHADQCRRRVLRNETVRTGADSATRLVMIDSTNLSLGANSSLTLDRTVFNDEHSYRDVTIRLTTGAFRFVTGHSDKTAYKITTPLATIGVRGTTLDILSQRGRSVVVLQDGAARVCTLSFQCIELTQPGDTAIITSSNGKTTITEDQHAALDLRRDLCGRRGAVHHHAICRRLADHTPAVEDDPTGMLCGR